jgi:hypothetical protein
MLRSQPARRAGDTIRGARKRARAAAVIADHAEQPRFWQDRPITDEISFPCQHARTQSSPSRSRAFSIAAAVAP